MVTSSAEDELIFKLADIAPETRKRNDCSAAMSHCISEKNSFIFTAAYLAPELLKVNSNMNENKAIACDIYSFPMMMYQVLFPNVPLFEEINPIQFIIAVTNKWRPSIPEVSNSHCKFLILILRKKYSKWAYNWTILSYLGLKFPQIQSPKGNFLLYRIVK